MGECRPEGADAAGRQPDRQEARRSGGAQLDPDSVSAHGLRSGYLTEAARQGVPLTEAMAQSQHRSVSRRRATTTMPSARWAAPRDCSTDRPWQLPRISRTRPQPIRPLFPLLQPLADQRHQQGAQPQFARLGLLRQAPQVASRGSDRRRPIHQAPAISPGATSDECSLRCRMNPRAIAALRARAHAFPGPGIRRNPSMGRTRSAVARKSAHSRIRPASDQSLTSVQASRTRPKGMSGSPPAPATSKEPSSTSDPPPLEAGSISVVFCFLNLPCADRLIVIAAIFVTFSNNSSRLAISPWRS